MGVKQENAPRKLTYFYTLMSFLCEGFRRLVGLLSELLGAKSKSEMDPGVHDLSLEFSSHPASPCMRAS